MKKADKKVKTGVEEGLDNAQSQVREAAKQVEKLVQNVFGAINQQEKESILGALTQTHGNKTKAAELLGVSFRTLRYRIKKLGL